MKSYRPTLWPLAVLLSLSSCANLKGGDGPAEFHLPSVDSTRLGLSVGYSLTDTSTDEDPVFDGSVDESDTTLKVGLAAGIHPNVDIEASWVDFGETEFDGLFGGTSSVGTVDTQGFQLAVTGRTPVGDQGLRLTGTLGLLFWDQDEEELFGGLPDNESDSGTDPLFGLGVERDLGDHVTLRFEATRYLTVNGDDIDTFMLSALFGL